MKTISTVVTLVIFLLGLGFSLLNVEPIALNYYFGTIHLSSGLALVLAFVIGGLFGIIVSHAKRRR